MRTRRCVTEIDEGLCDHALEREEQIAGEVLVAWAVEVAGACCDLEDAGFLAHARRQLGAAHRRALAAGALDDQPGEAEWMTMHRLEREID